MEGIMKYPIRINTLFGAEQFDILNIQSNSYKEQNKLGVFQLRCLRDNKLIEDYLKFFLEDKEMMRKYRMDEVDTVGIKIYNQISDIASVLLYFSGYTNKKRLLGVHNEKTV
jgi:uncharacterized protein YkuJ